AHLCFGVLRYYPRLQAWLKQLLRHPLKEQDTDVNLLLMVGLYQLFYSDTPAFACLNETVEATTHIKKNWAKALVNGVLRNATRQKEKLLMLHTPAEKTCTPEWLIKKWQNAYPHQWQTICDEQLKHPPFSLRVNAGKISREDYLQLLAKQQLEATHLAYCSEGIVLSEAMNVDALPGFSEGLVSVQDGAAQLAAHLLNVKPGQHILDACGAPGSKAAHLVELCPTLSLLALEKDPERCELMRKTFSRMGMDVPIICEDASKPELWWDKKPFDSILLDAPCSATGVIRRHPDIKLHRRHQDIPLLVQQQKTLLEKLWPLVKPNGILLYVTCSLLPEENVALMEQFLQSHHDAKELPIMEDWGIGQKIGRQILPGMHHMDGFYYARLLKQV
ncbi:MAG: 16S rRNA (cytosine(967)-C(5))-methyltransferase RsmB, partial [Proteobacteria bacterium]|nr:16S rRNA (cytosine(967)-C(5))-methyltransferase RsmB [Pseudomonadota bacterium]